MKDLWEKIETSLQHTLMRVFTGSYSRQIMLLVHVLNKVFYWCWLILDQFCTNFSFDYIIKVLYAIYLGVCYLVLNCFISYFATREPRTPDVWIVDNIFIHHTLQHFPVQRGHITCCIDSTWLCCNNVILSYSLVPELV